MWIFLSCILILLRGPIAHICAFDWNHLCHLYFRGVSSASSCIPLSKYYTLIRDLNGSFVRREDKGSKLNHAKSTITVKVYFHAIFVRHIHISARVWSLRREGEDIFIPFQSCLVEHLWWLRQFLKLSMQSIHIYTLQIQEYLCTLQWRFTRYLFFTLKEMIVLHDL